MSGTRPEPVSSLLLQNVAQKGKQSFRFPKCRHRRTPLLPGEAEPTANKFSLKWQLPVREQRKMNRLGPSPRTELVLMAAPNETEHAAPWWALEFYCPPVPFPHTALAVLAACWVSHLSLLCHLISSHSVTSHSFLVVISDIDSCSSLTFLPLVSSFLVILPGCSSQSCYFLKG